MCLERSLNQYRLNIYTNMSTNPENLVTIGLVVSEISLLQATVKKEKTKKVTEAKHKLCPLKPRELIIYANIFYCTVLQLLWSPYGIGQAIIFSSCVFFFLSSSFFLFFPRLISAVGDWMFTIHWHMVWP